MAGFLNKLMNSNKKEVVYLSITPGVGIEIIKVASDPAGGGTVAKYGRKPLEYSETKRDIDDYDNFTFMLKELFVEMRVLRGSCVVLNMPIVYMGKSNVQLMLDDNAVEQILLSETEQSYLFKREEPVISWAETNSNRNNEFRTLLYTAIQKTTLDKLKEIFASFDLKLIRVETALISQLRALQLSGFTTDLMEDGVAWNYLIVNSTGYSIVAMSGKNIVDYYEEPLALRTYEAEEIYDAVYASAQIVLMGYPAAHLCVVSNTDMISAETLSRKINFDGEVRFLENNNHKEQPLIPTDLSILPDESSFISLEAIGIGASAFVDYPIIFNFLSKEEDELNGENALTFERNGQLVTITEQQINKFAFLIMFGIGIIPLLFSMLVMPKFVHDNQLNLSYLTSKVQSLDEEIARLTNPEEDNKFSPANEMNNILDLNKTKLESYIALGRSVPGNLWLTYFACDVDGEISIVGQADTVESVYSFFRNIKDSMLESGLRLHKLELQSDSIDEVLSTTGANIYNFEITNGTGAKKKTVKSDAPQASKPTENVGTESKPTKQKNKPKQSNIKNNLELIDIDE